MNKSRLPSIFKGYARARDGATAVEFALVGAPFLLLLFAIIELSLVFVVTTGLDGATTEAARQIRTGSFQQGGGPSKTAFRSLVCNNLPVLPNSCEDNLFVDVRTFNTFADLAANMAQSASSFTDSNTCFSPGAARDIVLVRVYYKWPLVTPGITAVFADAGGDKRMLTSVAVFRNEPYNDDPPVGARCT